MVGLPILGTVSWVHCGRIIGAFRSFGSSIIICIIVPSGSGISTTARRIHD